MHKYSKVLFQVDSGPLRDSVIRSFLLFFFHESVPPQPQSIPLGPFQICGDICKSRCTIGVNDTGGRFATSFANVVDTSGKFATGVNGTDGK